MYDCHYDLLTFIYMNKDSLKDVKKHCEAIFNVGIQGGIFNLFYMSPEEMKNELDINIDELNIINNLKEVNKIIKQEHLIPDNIKYVVGIEGLDYLNKLEDLDILYELGVRSVNPVWNNHNKFGTGVRPIKKVNEKNGLTTLGKELIHKLIETKIAIDVSHSDEETFWDIINVCKKNKASKPQLLASHSNCKVIHNVPRNLNDEQIKAIAQLNGIIGAVSVKSFCGKDNYEQAYIEHIIHMRNILGSVNNIALATDDMTYYKIQPEIYKHLNIFKHEEADKNITEILKKNEFNNNEISIIKNNNFLNTFFC